jgi:hypothetical protein
VLLVPILGPALYFTFEPERLIRQAFKRKKLILGPADYPNFDAPEAHSTFKDQRSEAFFNLTQNISSFLTSSRCF